MQAEYKRDIDHSYLILRGDGELNPVSYRLRMLTGNKIPGLLPCRLQGMDGASMLCYEITGKQPIEVLFERRMFQRQEVEVILRGILEALENLRAYLLEPDSLVLEPKYIYLDNEEHTISLCCFPERRAELKEQLKSFAEYLLPRVDTKDAQAVELSYLLYRRVMERELLLDPLKEALYGQNREESRDEHLVKEEAKQREIPDGEEEQQRKDALDAFFEEDPPEEKKASRLPLFLLLALLLGAAGGIVWLWWNGFWDFVDFLYLLDILPMQKLLGAAAGAIGVHLTFCVFRWLFRKRKERRESLTEAEEEPEPFEEQETAEEEPPAENVRQTAETSVLSREPGQKNGTLVSKHPGEFPTIFLEEELTVVGKLPVAADVILDSASVSRIHARITKKDGEYFLTDLNSRNGTCVNGKILQGDEECRLENYDEVSFADVRYVFLK